IHFYHVRSPVADATPLILTHGWPGSVVEFVDLIGPLTDPASHGGDPNDAFHVVIPSLPGYGFSQPNDAKGWEPRRTARAWAQLGWIAEKFRSWTDCNGVIENAVSRDDLLTNAMVYWITNTGASSARFYYEAMRSGALFPQPRLATPVGHACFPKEVLAAPRS